MKKAIAIATILLTAFSLLAILSLNTKASPQFQFKPIIESPVDEGEPYILQDSTSKIWVFFGYINRTANEERRIFYVTSVNGGVTWSDPSLFTPAFMPGRRTLFPVAFQDSTGRIWVAWLNHTAPHNADQVWFTTSDDGENWTPARLLCNGHNDMGGFIEVDGKVWFLFSPLSSYWHASYKTTDDGGNTWSNLTPITVESGMRGPHATVLSDGTIFVVYRVGDYSFEANIGYSTSSDGGATWISGVADDPPYPEWDDTPRVNEYNEKVYVTFARSYTQEGEKQDVWLRIWDKTKWETPQQVTNSSINSINNLPSLTFIDNQLWIAFQTNTGGVNRDLWLAYLHDQIIPPPPPKKVSIELSGEFDYLPWENIPVKIAAIVTDSNGESISGANVTITIYDPEENLWTVEAMSENMTSGVYLWVSDKTVREIFKDHGKGVYVAHATASYNNGSTAEDILLFHIDPPPELDKLPIIIVVSVASAVIVALAAIFFKKKRSQ